MKNIIIGTAGHIDHGKTALIRCLTGIETDRLKEEKKRGITIDLGFAHLPLPNGETAGIIDVPGHEKFIKNMLAGIGGIDMALLIVAADEGVMPQTVEHLNILSILRIKRGIVVVTKSELVDAEWLELIKTEIKEATRGTFLEASEILAVSSVTGEGIEPLKQCIYKLTSEISQRDISAPIRIPVDRVFTVSGFGTVVTGTQVEGTLSVGESVMIYPQGIETKVKNIQVHSSNVEKSYAGQRVAVNLTGVKVSEVERGNVLAAVRSMTTTMIVDVKLELLKSIPRTVKNRMRIRFHHGTAEVMGRLILLEGDELESGNETFAQIRLEEQISVKSGDLFVIRYYSPVETLGGGVVLNANPLKHKRFREAVLTELQARNEGAIELILEQEILRHGERYESIPFYALQMGQKEEAVLRAMETLAEQGAVVKIADEVYVHSRQLEALQVKAIETLNLYHERHPLRKGMSKEEFRSRLFKKEVGKRSEAVIKRFADELLIVLDEDIVFLKGFKIRFNEIEQRAMERIEHLYKEGAYKPPLISEACAEVAACDLLIQHLVDSRVLVRIDSEILIHQLHFEVLLEKMKVFFESHDRITLAESRDLMGTSRKYAVPIMEYLDRIKVTKKTEDYRILLPS